MVTYDSKGKRDPFEPLISGKGEAHVINGLSGVQTADDIHLEGVVVDKVRGSYVVANGVVLAEGATEEGVKAVEIKEEGVLFDIHVKKEFKPFQPDR